MASLQFGQTQPPPRPTMTAEEAEDVIALWAQRQQETDPLQTLPSVHELSEVLNAPPSEVMALLDQVRAKQPVKKVKRSYRWMRIPAAVAGILMLMGVSGAIGYEIAGSGRHYPPAVYGGPSYTPPAGYTVTFDGYAVPGEGVRPTQDSELMAALERAMSSTIQKMAPDRSIVFGHSTTVDQMVTKLQEGKPIPGILEFRPASILGQDHQATTTIPALVRHLPEFESLVSNEQDRRIKQLVSDFVVGKLPTTK